MRFGTNFSLVGKFNENAVIHALRAMGPASQTQIADATELSGQTVSAIVNSLTDRGYLREVRTESVGRGRPRIIMDIVPRARYAIGVHVDPSVMTAVTLDLRGRVVSSASSEEVDPEDPDTSMASAADLVRQLMAETSLSGDRLVGVSLAVPGPLDGGSETIGDSVWLPGWAGAPVGRQLSGNLGMPVPVVKDTLAAVIGENWVRAGEVLESTMVFVYLGSGTGVGLSHHGEPLRGSSGNAGEIGTILLTLGAASRRSRSGLENDPVVMVEEAHERGILKGPLPGRTATTGADKQFRTLCKLAGEGDVRSVEILEAAGGRIAEMVVMTSELFDADMVVFGGPYWELVRPWYEPAAIAALDRPSARGPHPVEVSSTAMDKDVGAIGAASVVLDQRYVPRAPRR